MRKCHPDIFISGEGGVRRWLHVEDVHACVDSWKNSCYLKGYWKWTIKTADCFLSCLLAQELFWLSCFLLWDIILLLLLCSSVNMKPRVLPSYQHPKIPPWVAAHSVNILITVTYQQALINIQMDTGLNCPQLCGSCDTTHGVILWNWLMLSCYSASPFLS